MAAARAVVITLYQVVYKESLVLQRYLIGTIQLLGTTVMPGRTSAMSHRAYEGTHGQDSCQAVRSSRAPTKHGAKHIQSESGTKGQHSPRPAGRVLLRTVGSLSEQSSKTRTRRVTRAVTGMPTPPSTATPSTHQPLVPYAHCLPNTRIPTVAADSRASRQHRLHLQLFPPHSSIPIAPTPNPNPVKIRAVPLRQPPQLRSQDPFTAQSRGLLPRPP